MADLKSFLGVAEANLKSIHGIAKADLKSIVGLDIPSGGGAFSPTDVPNMLLWLDASQMTGLNDGDLVTSMTDFSGNGFHAQFGSDGSRPTFETGELNGLPVFRFNGSQGRQLAATPDVAESSFDIATYSIFWVAKRTSGFTVISKNTTGTSGGGRRKIQVRLDGGIRLNAGADSNSILYSTGVNTGVFHIGGAIGRGNSDHDLIFNGTLANFTTTLDDTTFNNQRVEIGQAFANGAERLTGDIATVLVYSGDVGATARDNIIAYLSDLWGIAV